MRMTNMILRLLVLAATTLPSGACSGSEAPEAKAPAVVPASVDTSPPMGQAISGAVLETMDAAGYTYVLVDTGDQQVWAAGPQTSVTVGEQVYLTDGMAMRDFHSETLDRTFDAIYFVGSIKGGSAPAAPGSVMQQAISGHGQVSGAAAPASAVDLSNIEKVSGGSTVAELFEGGQKLEGQEVSVRGRVVKVNAGIMGRNWLHIRDGSGSEGSNDLTVTTADMAKLGDLVVIRGTLKTNQDFGHGYSYEILVEQAKVQVE